MSSQNRFCDRCGTAVPSLDSEFCSSCGSRVTVAMNEPTEEPTFSALRGDVAGGGRKGIQLARIILAVGSLIFPPFGVGVGLWYLLKKKERGFGGLLLGLAIIPFLLVSLLSSDNASDSDDSTGDVSEIASTATPTPAPTEAKTTFDDNLSAYTNVKVGMSSDEFFEMEKKTPEGQLATGGIRQIIDFKETSEGGLLIQLSDGRYLRLTPEGVEAWPQSLYYAYIFHPTITAQSQPTIIFFEITDVSSQDATVIWVGRVSCDLVEEMIILSPSSSKEWPYRSACSSG
jgi:hypothetical protein